MNVLNQLRLKVSAYKCITVNTFFKHDIEESENSCIIISETASRRTGYG